MFPHNNLILVPVFALAAWTAGVLVLMGVARIGAGLRGRVRPSDFKLGESSNVPPKVSLPNRNYMNLLELPVLFYVVCIVLYVTGSQNGSTLFLAWAYVALRIIHSAIHLSYNNVMHRLFAFALSNAVLVALWVVAGLGVFSKTGA